MRNNGAWFSLWTLFTLAGTLTPGLNPAVGANAALMLLLGYVLALPLLLLYSAFAARVGQHDLFVLLPMALGKFPGKCLAALLMAFAYLFSGLMLILLVEMISLNALPRTLRWLLAVVLLLPAAYGAFYGGKTLGRAAQLLLPCAALILLVTLGVSLRSGDLHHLFPLLGEGLLPTLRGSAFFAFVPFGEGLLLYSLCPGKPPRYAAASGCLLAALLGAFLYARNQLVFGPNWLLGNTFYSYSAAADALSGIALQRLDLSTVMVYTALGVLRISVGLYCIVKGLGCLFHPLKRRARALLLLLFCLPLVFAARYIGIGSPLMELLHRYYALLTAALAAGIPLLVGVCLLLRGKLKKRSLPKGE